MLQLSAGSASEGPPVSPTVEPREPNRQRVYAIVGFAACLLVLAVATFELANVGRYDAKALLGFIALERPSFLKDGRFLVDLVTPASIAALGLLIVLTGAWRRGWRGAVGLVVAIAGPNLSVELLKAVTPVHGTTVLGLTSIGAGSFPSGHATAAASIVLGALAALPSRGRPFVAVIGGGYLVAIGYSMPMLKMHYPSDVLAGYLLAALWASIGSMVTARGSEGPRPGRQAGSQSRLPMIAAWVGSLGLAVAALAIASAPVRDAPVAVAVSSVGIAFIAMLALVVVDRITCEV